MVRMLFRRGGEESLVTPEPADLAAGDFDIEANADLFDAIDGIAASFQVDLLNSVGDVEDLNAKIDQYNQPAHLEQISRKSLLEGSAPDDRKERLRLGRSVVALSIVDAHISAVEAVGGVIAGTKEEGDETKVVGEDHSFDYMTRNLHPHFLRIESLRERSAEAFAGLIEEDALALSALSHWLRFDIQPTAERTATRNLLKQVLSADVHDSNSHIVAAANGVEHNYLDSRFPDWLRHSDEKVHVDTQKWFKLIAYGDESDAAIMERIGDVDNGGFPRALEDVVREFRYVLTMKAIKDIELALAPHYLSRLARPSYGERTKIERSTFNVHINGAGDAVHMANRKTSGSARQLVNRTVELQKTKEREPQRRALHTINQHGVVEEGASEVALTDAYVATQKGMSTADKEKLSADTIRTLKALRIGPTGNRGQTSLNERASIGGNKVWRANPAHFTGLSVGEAMKDTRILYTFDKDNVYVLGIFRHDDYMRFVNRLPRK